MTYAERHGIKSMDQILDEDCWRFFEEAFLGLSVVPHKDGKYSLQEHDAWCVPGWRSARGPLKDCVKQAIMELDIF